MFKFESYGKHGQTHLHELFVCFQTELLYTWKGDSSDLSISSFQMFAGIRGNLRGGSTYTITVTGTKVWVQFRGYCRGYYINVLQKLTQYRQIPSETFER